MRTELFSRSKYRDEADPGDDVPLLIPGRVYGVFDGATDPRGTRVNGVTTGRLAALAVAAEVAALAQEPGVDAMDGREIIRRLEAVLRREFDDTDLPIPPSTTAAFVLDCGENWRFLLLGDTGLRLNATEVFRDSKLIDTVATIARVAAFKALRNRIEDAHETELGARTCILLGFDNAVEKGLLSGTEVSNIIDLVLRKTDLFAHAEIVRAFLWGGIQTQHRFGNAEGNPLCFDTLNGTESKLTELLDVTRSKSDVASIELFTDGYEALADQPTVESWEASFAKTEADDFHRVDRFANVKGSTSTQWFDDRSVIVLKAR
ncbi:hypothetical protein [Aliiruegeria lutimaris]|uniref:Protein phosphatase 2C n=1 Tax=Aliiruegeria lutimaris TaxID=571298 RepID=A0A1G9FH88_9RHOB|nr:hypothetical protein [Aliiruegeria lutimaris]SDK87513.1 hypothetical protein SAMN04488026_105720 [Aliiruegeria lutimaris]